MLTEKEIVSRYRNRQKLSIAVIGDSTGSGIEANVGPNVWTNGVPYAAVNQPNAYPNLDPSSPYFINITTYPSQEQQDNLAIPSAVRLLRTAIEARNSASRVYNYSVPGIDAAGHIALGTVGIIAALPEKPDMCIVNLGINSSKDRVSHYASLKQLVSSVQQNGMFCLVAQSNNVGVTGSPAGSWSETELPDNWFPLDYWPTTVAETKQVHREMKTGFVNLGTDDLQLDITKLYDPFHPNPDGFIGIAAKYERWFEIGTIPVDNGAMIKTANGVSYYQPKNGNQAFKAKLSTGQIVSMPLSIYTDELRIRSGFKLATFKGA